VSVAGLILAAGESRRMGSPKALLQYHGETFLDRLIGIFAAKCSPVIVVVGAHRDMILSAVRRATEAVVVENAEYRLGQLSSMQCGLRAVPDDLDGVLFTLVDHPAVRADTIDYLLAGPAAPLRIPRYGGRRGHPIFFTQGLIREFLALPVNSSAKEVVTRHAPEIGYVDVDDPGVITDVDDAEAYRRLLAETVS